MTPKLSDLMIRVEFPNGESYLADPDTCTSNGLSRDEMVSFAPLQLPDACDVGEVVYMGQDDLPASWLDWRSRRTIKRFAEAYYQVYRSFLSNKVNR